MTFYYLHQENQLYFCQSTAFSVLLSEDIKEAMEFLNENNALKFKQYISHEFDLDLSVGKKVKEPGFNN